MLARRIFARWLRGYRERSVPSPVPPRLWHAGGRASISTPTHEVATIADRRPLQRRRHVSLSPPGYAAPVAQHPAEVRSRFMTRVYLHLLVGIAAFIGIEVFLFSSGIAYAITDLVASTNWLLILGGFMVVSWLGTSFAWKTTSTAGQYAGYGVLVVANALLFAAPLVLAVEFAPPNTVSTAAWISIGAFTGLSGIAITTGKDFGFLRGLLLWGGVLALCAIVGAVLFGFELGTWFSVAMIGFAGGAILYDTQKIYRSYPPDREIAAAMSLFSSLALLFWYVLRLLTRR
jgi:FtsH-binding integral membrane protein